MQALPHPSPPRANRWPYITAIVVAVAVAVVAVAFIVGGRSDESSTVAESSLATSPTSASATSPSELSTSTVAEVAPETTTTTSTTLAPTTTGPLVTAPPTTVAPVVVQPTIVLPPILVQPTVGVAPPSDPFRIAPGVIEDGIHYGYLTNSSFSGTLTFDRVDIEPDGTWTNTNPRLRTMPVASWAWSIPFPYSGMSIQVVVEDQRVVGVYEI